MNHHGISMLDEHMRHGWLMFELCVRCCIVLLFFAGVAIHASLRMSASAGAAAAILS